MMRILMLRQPADLQHVTDAQLKDAEAHLMYMRQMKAEMKAEMRQMKEEMERKLREAAMERTYPYRLMRLKQIQSAGRTPDQR